MPISPARQLARDVLLEVDQRQGYASDLLHSSLGRGLKLADRRLATEIVMGVLRWRAQLDYVIELAARRPVHRIDPLALAALRIGVYQLRFLTRVPAMAAVHESVEMMKPAQPRLAGFVNAVLRHVSPEPITALLAAELDLGRRREIEFSHPAWLLERWSRNYGPDAADRIAEYNNRTPPTAIRLGAGLGADFARAELALAPELTLEPGRILTAARRVVKGDITKTALFREGGAAVQDEASQLIAYLLEPQPRHRILDACAAPGGKAALLRALAPEAYLVAVEFHGHRARRLRRLLSPDALTHVVGADASRPLPFNRLFDRVLVDAPCTGTGTLARNPEIRWRLTPEDPARMALLQKTILTRAAASLAPGGRLVYSVCSIEPEEGREVVSAALDADPALTLRPAASVLDALRAAGHLRDAGPPLAAGSYLEVLPGAAATDGFFAAVIERRG